MTVTGMVKDKASKTLYRKETGSFQKSCHEDCHALGGVVYTFTPSTLEAEAVGALWGQGHPGLHSKFRATLSCVVRPYVVTAAQLTSRI